MGAPPARTLLSTGAETASPPDQGGETGSGSPFSRGEGVETKDLFLLFFGMGLVGFGGVLPWARRGLVEKRAWMTPDEFSEALALAQFLPGPNIVNLSIVVGQRFKGPAGSAAAVLGLLGAPVVVVLTLAEFYLAYAQEPALQGALAGVTAAAAGLLVAMAAKMAQPLFRAGAGLRLVIAALTFAAVGIAGFPLLAVLLVVGSLSIALAWWKVR